LYSIVPDDGSGDFTVARNSTATYLGADGLIKTAAIDEPRIEFNLDGSYKGLLVEPQRTNLVFYSEEFDDAYWTKQNGAVTANTQVAPDGTTTADTLTSDGGSVTADKSCIRRQNVVAADGNIYSRSIFLKKGNTRYGWISALNVSFVNNRCIIFDFDDEVVTFQNTIEGFAVEKFEDGWYRLSIAVIANSDLARNFSAGMTKSPTTFADHDSGDFIHIWGAQFETGSVATSYIPTVAAAATRNADVISKTGVSGFIGQSQGTLYAEINVDKLLGIQSRYIFNISDGTADNRIYLAFSGASSNILRARVWSGGVLQATIDTTTISTLGIRKLAIGYANNDVVFYMNGVQIGTDNSASIPACSQVNLGSSQGNLAQLNDRIRAAAIYTTRLSNTELASLTSL
jgi:hypothetical protein